MVKNSGLPRWRALLLGFMCSTCLLTQSGAATNTSAGSIEHLPLVSGAHARPLGAPKQGLLYKVARGGQVAYLFGTVHVGARSFYPWAPEVSLALSQSAELVLELDIRAEAAYAQAVLDHASYRNGGHIGGHIAPATLARLTATLHASGITVASVAHLKPWLIANMLVGLELHRSGFDRSQGNESMLLAHAQAHGTTITELESADYQLALFDSLSAAQSERYLLETLDQLADGTSLRKARATLDAWTSGNVSALEALIPDAVDGGTVTAEFTRHMILGKRNPEMAGRIERIMQAGKTAFVGVGLLHLLGADGLPRLLSQRGYQVERVY